MKNEQQIFTDNGGVSIPDLWNEEMKSISDLFGDKTNFIYHQLMHLRELAVAGITTVTDKDRKSLEILDKLISSAHNLTILDAMLQTIVKAAEIEKEVQK